MTAKASLRRSKQALGDTDSATPNYLPVRFIHTEKVSREDKLSLAFDALALEAEPPVGTIVHGKDFVRSRVYLGPLLEEARNISAEIKGFQENKKPPAMILNDHCAVCEFKKRCHTAAVEKDDLSLLRGMTAKEISKQHKKGIFTVAQLSHTFRPRKARRTTKVFSLKHHHSLQALAIRENTVYVAERPHIPAFPTQIYMDVEGDPDTDSYYLIGLLVWRDNAQEQVSFWADEQHDEGDIWRAFLRMIEACGDFTIFQYGSYESHFINRMAERYGGNADLLKRVASCSVNVLSLIYARIYFPVYSNALKSIATYLRFQWSVPEASGIQAIVWRCNWLRTKAAEAKAKLLAYNREDCLALQRLVYSLRSISEGSLCIEGDAKSRVLPVDDIKPRSFYLYGNSGFAFPELAHITKCAYFNYQRDKVLFRTSPLVRKAISRKSNKARKRKHRPNRRATYRALRECPRCGGTCMSAYRKTKKLVLDLKVSKSGVKRSVTEHVASYYRCADCHNMYLPKKYLAITSMYGSILRAWVIYSSIALRQTNENISESLIELFGYRISPGMVTVFKQEAARFYRRTYRAILKQLINGRLIHADETKVSIKGQTTNGYVWAFANMEAVAYMAALTREGSTVKETLNDFRGVLVSDFYSAYDSLACPQQKCLIHLARDFNDDLLKHPFDEELRDIGHRITMLLQSIVATIDRYGLKRIHLHKHKQDVERFYSHVFKREYTSDLAKYYQKRIEKYKEKLFTFLDYDGVPWNNNTAENAIKCFVTRRKGIGTAFTEDGIAEYLVFLSIYQTLRYRGGSFLKFLLSGKRDIESFLSDMKSKSHDIAVKAEDRQSDSTKLQ